MASCFWRRTLAKDHGDEHVRRRPRDRLKRCTYRRLSSLSTIWTLVSSYGRAVPYGVLLLEADQRGDCYWTRLRCDYVHPF